MKTLIRNIGQIVSGDITHPVVDADSLLARDGVIIGLGQGLEDDADLVVDAKGSTVMPGLVDSHVHPVFGDFTPRQRALDFVESAMQGNFEGVGMYFEKRNDLPTVVAPIPNTPAEKAGASTPVEITRFARSASLEAPPPPPPPPPHADSARAPRRPTARKAFERVRAVVTGRPPSLAALPLFPGLLGPGRRELR